MHISARSEGSLITKSRMTTPVPAPHSSSTVIARGVPTSPSVERMQQNTTPSPVSQMPERARTTRGYERATRMTPPVPERATVPRSEKGPWREDGRRARPKDAAWQDCQEDNATWQEDNTWDENKTWRGGFNKVSNF